MSSKRLLFLTPEQPGPKERSDVTEQETTDIAAALQASQLTILPFTLHRSGEGVSETAPGVWRACRENEADSLLLSPLHLILAEQVIILQEIPVFLLGSEGKPVRRIFLEFRELFSIPKPSDKFPRGTTYRVANFRNGGASITDEERRFFLSKLKDAGRNMSRLDIGQIGRVPTSSEEWARQCKGVNALLMDPGQLINAYLGLILPRPRAQHVFEDKGKYYEYKVLSETLPRAT